MSSASHLPAGTLAPAARQLGAHPAAAPVSQTRPGTFAPGTKVQVGSHRVIVEKYLSEGGFAHVYVVRVPKDGGQRSDVAVLKRVAVPDKEALASMRTEVETMKKLKGHTHIVTYIDSHASQLKGGGYEVFLLMEYCEGGGLIDFMNTRLQYRLTEPEILKIFSDVAEGVACMHYLRPPLLHRDLKVENVLISGSTSPTYKLCDFGSAAPPRPAAKTAAEGRLIEDDVQRHTTLQYRSPEMVDVYRKQPIDEKSDIWALGVLLYKLCYYTTPFEEQGQMAILNATFKYPAHPNFSERTKKLIAWMLRESPQKRPNIYQVMQEVCSMRGTKVPIKDIYAQRTHSEARRNEQLPPSATQVASPPAIGLQKAVPLPKATAIPEVTPMRRGRPQAPVQAAIASKPSPSPARGTVSDPFTALDSASAPVRAAAVDELAARFPSLDEFSLLHDRGAKFEFGQTTVASTAVAGAHEDLKERVTQALADDAFAQPSSVVASSSRHTTAPSNPVLVKSPGMEHNNERAYQPPLVHQPTPQRPVMVSTGTMTAPSPPLPSSVSMSNTPQQVVPGLPLPSTTDPVPNLVHASQRSQRISGSFKPGYAFPSRPSLIDTHRSKSHTPTVSLPKSPASSRPSLEGQRPSALDIGDSISRSKSAETRSRPASMYINSNMDYLKQYESGKELSFGGAGGTMNSARPTSSGDAIAGQDETKISSDMEFLRAMEGDESSKKQHHGFSNHRKSKRSSLPGMSLSGTKNILASKFGEAFRRFEGNSTLHEPRSHSPLSAELDSPRATEPTSEPMQRRSEGEDAIDETEPLTPEVRRELERRRLSQEERRVAQAAAEFRKRLAEQGEGRRAGPGVTRASTIQNRVKSLLDGAKPVPARTAQGYGHFNDAEKGEPATWNDGPMPTTSVAARPVTSDPYSKAPKPSRDSKPPSAPPTQPPRPNAPPKPKALRAGIKPETTQGSATRPPLAQRPLVQAAEVSPTQNAEDWEANFSKRYPSLSGLELVETEIDKLPSARLRTKDV